MIQKARRGSAWRRTLKKVKFEARRPNKLMDSYEDAPPPRKRAIGPTHTCASSLPVEIQMRDDE